jgi:hypothetical protein
MPERIISYMCDTVLNPAAPASSMRNGRGHQSVGDRRTGELTYVASPMADLLQCGALCVDRPGGPPCLHDVGNCYFWHVKKAGMLTQAFLHGIFHPQRAYRFHSCSQNTRDTGNNILVYFTEAAGGANMLPVLDSMKIPHAGSYEAAKLELAP